MYPEAVHQIMAMMCSLMGWQLLNPAKIIKEPRFLFWNFRCARRNRFFDPLRKGNHFLTLQNLYRNLLNIFKDKINVEAKYLNIEKIYKTSMNINIQATGYGGIVRSIVYVFVHIKKNQYILARFIMLFIINRVSFLQFVLYRNSYFGNWISQTYIHVASEDFITGPLELRRCRTTAFLEVPT